jgi:hypothetical protein
MDKTRNLYAALSSSAVRRTTIFVFVSNEHGNMPVFVYKLPHTMGNADIGADLQNTSPVPSSELSWKHRILILWGATLRSLIEVHCRFVGTYCLHLQGSRVSHARS